MFEIRGRQKPVFSLSDVRKLCKIVESVFSFENILQTDVLDFDLATSARINEMNMKLFVAKAKTIH